jgi:hypothetical protein
VVQRCRPPSRRSQQHPDGWWRQLHISTAGTLNHASAVYSKTKSTRGSVTEQLQ